MGLYRRGKIYWFTICYQGRRMQATLKTENGVDLYKVKELLGHKTLTMTTRYVHHYPESLRASVEIFDVCYNSATLRVGAIDK